jgi:hypothetical protein
LAPTPAFAGAWIAPEGGQEIWTNSFSMRDESGVVETQVFWEEPFGERMAFVASPWIETNYDTADGWRAEAVIGLKRAVFRDDENVMALQAGALWVSHPNPGCGEGGVEARWLGGRSFGGGAFLNLEAAGRVLEHGCGGERVDVTAGYRPTDNWLAMGQVFVDVPWEAEESVKVQLSLVRFNENGYGVQLGLRLRVDDGPQEPALMLGLWSRSGG